MLTKLQIGTRVCGANRQGTIDGFVLNLDKNQILAHIVWDNGIDDWYTGEFFQVLGGIKDEVKEGWDKKLTQKLVAAGLSWEAARIAIGEIVEQKQIADREGYDRGYQHGYTDARKKYRVGVIT